MITIADVTDLKQIYDYQLQFETPYFFPVDYGTWKQSLDADADGEGRTLFRTLSLKAAYNGNDLVGFIQYGNTAFGFDSSGEISSDVSYCVIRNLYFNDGRADAGSLLLQEAMDAFSAADTVYAFFHYFGMSCFARHGKLFERHSHIEALLKQRGFQTEHENVYYSSDLSGGEPSEVEILPQNPTKGNQQYMDFMLSGKSVGGCEIHYIDSRTAYLRWIYVNGDITGQGIGTKCMQALRHRLHREGFTRFDTDTALSNTAAQHYYGKTGFTREGITRSFYRT